MENEQDKQDKLYNLSNKEKPLTEDDVRIIVSQQLRNIVAPTVVQAGYLQSGNFVSGTSGWQLSPTGAEFQSITISGVQLTTKGSFGGDGSDGALEITTGTTTIDLSNAATVTKNYTSISITGDGKLAFSNPHANGTIIYIKSQGNVTLTSSTAPMLDASGMGATSTNNGVVFVGTGATIGGDSSGSGAGAGGSAPTLRNDFNVANMSKFFTFFAAGAQGGNGIAQGAGSAGGTGGRGGGVLILECGGTLTFTTANGISVAGIAGTAGTQSSTIDLGGSGGGGGGGGTFVGLYNTAGTLTGTINVSGGSGGAGGARGSDVTNRDQADGAGGGGGASLGGTGGITGTTVNGAGAVNVAGAAGGAGFSIAVQNTHFS